MDLRLNTPYRIVVREGDDEATFDRLQFLMRSIAWRPGDESPGSRERLLTFADLDGRRITFQERQVVDARPIRSSGGFPEGERPH